MYLPSSLVHDSDQLNVDQRNLLCVEKIRSIMSHLFFHLFLHLFGVVCLCCFYWISAYGLARNLLTGNKTCFAQKRFDIFVSKNFYEHSSCAIPQCKFLFVLDYSEMYLLITFVIFMPRLQRSTAYERKTCRISHVHSFQDMPWKQLQDSSQRLRAPYEWARLFWQTDILWSQTLSLEYMYNISRSLTARAWQHVIVLSLCYSIRDIR